MIEDSFLNRVECEYVILAHSVDYEFITNKLEVKPDRCFNKGDIVFSKHSQRTGKRPHSLWALKSKAVNSDDINISVHIIYFQERLKNKIELIKKLSEQYDCECIFRISIETEDAGAGFDLNESEMSFINKIASRYTCMFITKEKID